MGSSLSRSKAAALAVSGAAIVFLALAVQQRLRPPPRRPRRMPKPPPRDRFSGELLAGKYALGKTMGRGRFGKVKIATNVQTGEHVAVKITERDQLPDPAMEEQLRREVAIMRKLKHPNVVRLLDVYQTPRTIYLVLELVTGGELLDKIAESRRFEERVARHYFQQLVLGLYFVHKNGIAHRDLKPENLMLDEKGNLKISDFGFSKQQISGSGRFNPNATMCGTPEYLAPDILAGTGYNGFLTDSWSCGVILYVMCAGCFPFGHYRGGGNAIFSLIEQGKFEMKDHFSPELKDLLSHIIVVDPFKRYNMEDIVRHPWMQPMPQAELEYVRNFNPCETTDQELAQAIAPAHPPAVDEAALDQPSMEPLGEEPVELVGDLTMHKSFAFPAFVEKKSNMRFGVKGHPNEVVQMVMKSLTALRARPDNSKSFLRIKATAAIPGGDSIDFNITVSDRGDGFCLLDVRREKGSTLSFHQVYRDLLKQLSSAGQEVLSGAGLRQSH